MAKRVPDGSLEGTGRQGATLPRWIPWISLLVLLLALALRLHWWTAFRGSPLFHSPAIDEALHWEWAGRLAAGSGSPEIPYFRAPLYPWWLGLLRRAGLGLAGSRAAGVLLGLLNLGLLFALARRRLASCSIPPLLALFGLSAALVYYEPMLLIPQLLILWLLGGSLLLMEGLRGLRARDEDPAGFSPRPVAILLLSGAGLCLGLAAIARPNALLLLPLLIWLPWREMRRRRPAAAGRIAAALLPPLAGFLLPVLVVASINGWPGSGVLLASQGGVNFWIGNNPAADGRSAVLPGVGPAWEREDASRLASADARLREGSTGGPPGPGEESRLYYGKGRRWLVEHPGRAAALYWRKLMLLLGPVEQGNNTSLLALSRRAPLLHGLLHVSWWIVLLPGLLGLALGYPKDGSLRRWCLGVLGLYSLSILLFFVNARFRLPLIPFLALPGAEFLGALFLGAKSRQRVRPRRGIIAAVLLLFPLLALSVRSGGGTPGWQSFQEGNAWFRLARPDSARAAYLEALRISPGLAEVRLNLGVLAQRANRPDLADSMYHAELAVHPNSAKAWNNLGNLSLAAGQASRAAERYRLALELRPGLGDADWNLGLCLSRLSLKALAAGDSSQAADLRREVLGTQYRGRGLARLDAALGLKSREQ